MLLSSSEIYNGAKCKSYWWSQSHSDLELRIKLTKTTSYEKIDVSLTSDSIKVTLLTEDKSILADASEKGMEWKKVCLLEGQFEHLVNSDSTYWLLDSEEPSIVIYIDKMEDKWWKKLLLNEEVTENGPRNYTIPMDHLDDGSRMAVDRLIVEHRNKITSNHRNGDDQLA